MRFLKILLCLLLPAVGAIGQTISPLDYGLRTARTGEERYAALYNAHAAANQSGATVSYKGVGDLDIAIPQNAKPIPLKGSTDFNGITLTVSNDVRDCALFTMQGSPRSISVDKDLIDSGNFKSVEALKSGLKLLTIEDQNSWCNTEGSSYKRGIKRRDVLLVRNGKALNATVMPYNNDASRPRCYYVDVDDTQKTIQNLTIKRVEGAKFKTKCFYLKYTNNVLFKNIAVYTPYDKEKFGDSAFDILHSTNFTMQDIIIEGSYSQTDKYGYGISMNNVYNSTFIRVSGETPWGFFGNNNVNVATLQDCRVNRFDVHCYGRDITAKNCTFDGKPITYGSLYGTLTYDGCTFKNSVPVYLRVDYNAYTPFDLVMKDCTYYPTAERSHIFNMGLVESPVNKRAELQKKCWPNVSIENLKVYSDEVNFFYIFCSGGTQSAKASIGNISKINITNVTPNNGINTIYMSNNDVRFANKVKCKIGAVRGKKISVDYNHLQNISK